VRHITSKAFWRCYDELPAATQRLANEKFQLLSDNPRHPALEFMPLRKHIWRVRVGDHYRAVARKSGDVFEWFWIGSHEAYNQLIKRL